MLFASLRSELFVEIDDGDDERAGRAAPSGSLRFNLTIASPPTSRAGTCSIARKESFSSQYRSSER